jgi:hypothetical protein
MRGLHGYVTLVMHYGDGIGARLEGAMKLGYIVRCLFVAAASVGAVAADAGTMWDETTAGDLSNDGLSPTALVMGIGSNRVLGAVGNAGQGVDRDYFKFTVPAGATLTSIVLLSNTQTAGVSFIGIQPGPQLTVTPSGGGAENLVALGHYGNDQIGTDLLPVIKIGTPGPLPAGTYSVWVQELSGTAPYGFDFVTTAGAVTNSVPTLPEWGLVTLGMLLAYIYWRRTGPPKRTRAPLSSAQARMATIRPIDQ